MLAHGPVLLILICMKAPLLHTVTSDVTREACLTNYPPDFSQAREAGNYFFTFTARNRRHRSLTAIPRDPINLFQYFPYCYIITLLTLIFYANPGNKIKESRGVISSDRNLRKDNKVHLHLFNIQLSSYFHLISY